MELGALEKKFWVAVLRNFDLPYLTLLSLRTLSSTLLPHFQLGGQESKSIPTSSNGEARTTYPDYDNQALLVYPSTLYYHSTRDARCYALRSDQDPSDYFRLIAPCWC